MTWFPRVNQVLIILKRLETGAGHVADSFDLFWTFCNSSVSRDELLKDVDRMRQALAGRPLPYFSDPEVLAAMKLAVVDLNGAVNEVVLRMDAIRARFEEYSSQPAVDRSKASYALAHLESARLVQTLNWQGLSAESKAALEASEHARARCEQALSDLHEAPWETIYSPSLKALGSFHSLTRFQLLRTEGSYEEALFALTRGIELFTETRILLIPHLNHLARTYEEMVPYNVNNKLQRTAPWLESLAPQTVADCFEAVRASGRVRDRQQFAATCQKLLNLCVETPWLRPRDPPNPWSMESLFPPFTPTLAWHPGYRSAGGPWWEQPKEIKELEDGEGEGWEPTLFWQRANWWAESQLQDSDLRNLLEGREDQSAKERLTRYFVDEEHWALIPARARAGLVNADRDWFAGSSSRTESLLNELKVATEELLLQGLWQPLSTWIEGQRRGDTAEFLGLKNDLESKNLTPDLKHYGAVCTMPVTQAFLKQKGLAGVDRQWFSLKLPKNLKALRLARRKAEHESRTWTRTELKEFVDEFLGIGSEGIIPRLVKCLF